MDPRLRARVRQLRRTTATRCARSTATSTVEDYFTRGKQPIAKRVCISDAIRACASDGELEPHERDTIHRMAGRLDIPAEVVDELVQIHREEQALKLRRIQLAFPDGMGM